MANIDNGFSVDILVIGDYDNDQILITQGDFNPSTVGYEAPQGSLFLRRDVPSIYTKAGPLDTDWVISGGAGGGDDELFKTSATDGTAGYLGDKLVGGAGLTITESGTGNKQLTLDYTGVDREQTIFVGKHGNDSNDGFTQQKAKLTFAGAITAAVTLVPSSSNKISIICEDGGTYTETFSVPSFVLIDAPNATFEGNITVTDNAEFKFQEVSASSGDVINKTGTGTGWIEGEIVTATGNANGVVNAVSTSIAMVNVRQIFVENGAGLLDNSNGAGHIHLEIEDIYITGTGTAISRPANNGTVVGRCSHILETGAGVGNGTAMFVNDGRLALTVGRIDTATAYSVSGVGELDLFVNEITPTSNRIQLAGSAKVNVIQSDSLRWNNKSSNFTARRTEFVAIDTSNNAVTMTLPSPASNGDSVTFQDALNTFGTNNLTINAQAGGLIDDGGTGSQIVTLDVSGTAGVLIYNETLAKWTFSRIQEEVAFSPSNLIYVTKNGSDTIGDGSFSNPYLTVKKGATEASLIATANLPTTVKVLDGIYNEINPITITNPYVGIQGNSQTETIIQPTVNGQPLFALSGNTVGEGNTLESMRLQGKVNSGTDYYDVPGSNLIEVTGDGMYTFNQVDAKAARHGLDMGNGVITTAQNVAWTNSSITANFHGLHAGGTNTRLVGMNLMAVNNNVNIHAVDSGRVELNSFRICGPDPLVGGIGVLAEDTSTVIINGGLIHHLTDGIQVNDTAIVRGFSLEMRDNTTDIEQLTTTAEIIIQGTLSKTKQVILDGTNISLNYTDYDTDDFIVGNVQDPGTPGKEFRVREVDGRVAIGDYATDTNIADGGVGGSRTINVIDTNGNMRLWRYVTADGTDPAMEFIKGTATTADGAGRPAGPNPGDPAQDVRDGTGTVWWDVFLQETDELVFRRRTGGGGALEDERVRVRQDGSEWLGSTQYDDSDVATILNLRTQANAVNHLEIRNASTVNGPEIAAIGTDLNINIEMSPKGTGTVVVPVGYENNITTNSLITKQYADANYTGGGGTGSPGGPVQSVQWNDGGGNFGGEAELTYDDTNDQLVLDSATTGVNHLTVHGGIEPISAVDQSAAMVYWQVDGDATYDAMRVKFQRSTAGISGWISYNYDQATPNIRLHDEDDDSPYVNFNTIAGGTYDNPEFVSVFGARGALGTRDPGTSQDGFAWLIGKNVTPESLYTTYDPAMELDQQWLRIPHGTTGERPGAPVEGMLRYNDTTGKLEGYESGTWENLVETVTVQPKETFSAHNNTTTQVLTGSFVTAIIGTDIRSDASFSNTLGEVTVNKTANYMINYDIGADSTGARSSMEAVLQVNGVNVPGTFAYSYHRNTTNGEDTATMSGVPVSLTSGDVVRVRIRELSGGIQTLQNASRLTIKEID